MFKWFTSTKQQHINIEINQSSISHEEQELLIQKARFRLIGVSILFISILISLPFIIKKPEQRNRNISIKLINEEVNEDAQKPFKKIESETQKNHLKSNKTINNSYM